MRAPQRANGPYARVAQIILDVSRSAHAEATESTASSISALAAGYDPSVQVRPYGSAARGLGFGCAAHRDGAYCPDNPSGRGFMIASDPN